MTGAPTMIKITQDYRYVVRDRDRHGNDRFYFRRHGDKKVRLRARPGTLEFQQEYETALAESDAGRLTKENGPPTPNTWRWLCVRYMQSAEFRQLDPVNTQRPRRGILESTWSEAVMPGSAVLIGDCPLNSMSRKLVLVLRDRKGKFPDAANNRMKAIRRVFKWALENDLMTSNPARDVPRLRARVGGYHTWTQEEIAQFERRHPIGTTAALALALLRYTGQRRGDIVRFGRQHVREGFLKFTQDKNRNRNPISLQLPVLPALQKVIDASPTGDLTFLVNDYGQPFTVAGFGNKFREWCRESGLENCSAHGMRKAAATMLAENGATAHELMAWFGWRSLKEAERYTQAANQKKLAVNVVRLFGGAKDGT